MVTRTENDTEQRWKLARLNNIAEHQSCEAFPCASCGASAGTPCRTRDGLHCHHPHAARMRLAGLGDRLERNNRADWASSSEKETGASAPASETAGLLSTALGMRQKSLVGSSPLDVLRHFAVDGALANLDLSSLRSVVDAANAVNSGSLAVDDEPSPQIDFEEPTEAPAETTYQPRYPASRYAPSVANNSDQLPF